MFWTLSTLELQQYLWFIVSFIGAGLVFMLYVQWGQTLAILLAKSEEEKSEMLNTVGKRYEITFTSLVTFGGAFFAIFPLFYSTSFGGAYFVWFAVLFLFIIEWVAFKYRKKVGNFLGKRTYEIFLLLNGIGVPLLIWVAVATFFTGANFHVNKTNLLSSHAVSSWDSPWHWLEALWNPIQWAWMTNISFGLAIVLLTTILASLNIIKNIDDSTLVTRTRKYLLPATLAFLVFFLFFLFKVLTIDGFAYNSTTGFVSLEAYKYLYNLLEMPIVAWSFLIWVILVVVGIVLGYFTKFRRAFWFSAFGTFLVALTLLLIVWWNNTVFYPSLSDLQSSLTIENASSSRYTLIAIAYASLLAPIVLTYIAWVWNTLRDDHINKKNTSTKKWVNY
jgi:cytochrome d ubiquinol oxidase subunit II